MLLAQTRRRLRQLGLQAKKSLGQHFLVDEDILKLIVSSAELTSDDIVVEIGPGLGVLTEELAKEAGLVIAVEIDKKLTAVLKERMASYQNIVVINEDILKVTPASLLEEVPAANAGTTDYKVVANLPYYITSAVLRHFLEVESKPRIMVVMVQKDVAEAIVAEPGDMSMLSISVQFYGQPKIVSYVPARSFHPAPAVDSAILRIDRYPQPPVQIAEDQGFFNLVRAGFSAPRKQIANSLAQGLKWSKDEVSSLLEKAGIVTQRRAESLALDEWARLWQVF
ncbi:MAG: ribosomal RNA small subunit methyltransferase A, partial [Chloroflexi bacterium]|nr:ribosomal RNA small subunit methyltransferase A [Chloroflexota bacterium]